MKQVSAPYNIFTRKYHVFIFFLFRNVYFKVMQIIFHDYWIKYDHKQLTEYKM